MPYKSAQLCTKRFHELRSYWKTPGNMDPDARRESKQTSLGHYACGGSLSHSVRYQAAVRSYCWLTQWSGGAVLP